MTQRSHKDNTAYHHLRKVVRRARFCLLVERLAIPTFLLCLLVLAYLSLSWLGTWSYLSLFPRVLILLGFLAALSFIIRQFFRTPLPTNAEAIARVEAVSGIDHRPLTASLDKPMTRQGDKTAPEFTLWRAHQARMKQALKKLRSGAPTPQIQNYDRYALRTLVVLLAFIGFFAAGSDKTVRLADIFEFRSEQAVATTRLDAWATPPGYTQRPPLFLTADGETVETEVIILPENSILTIRTVNAGQPVVTFNADRGETKAVAALAEEGDPSNGAAGTETHNYEFELSESGQVEIALPDKNIVWQFQLIEDLAPTITFAVDPMVQASGAMEVVAILKDDYGIVNAFADIEPTDLEAHARASKKARPLYDAPSFPLSLNRGRVKDGTSKTVRSIVDHPFAGAEVAMTLYAEDEAEQQGRSDPINMTLPKRRFLNKIAKALVEQRLKLALNANYAPQLSNVLDALTIRPEVFEGDHGILIALASVHRQLIDARDDDALRDVVDRLWEIATGLEDGDLSDSRRNLQNALEALREGVENGASEDELARLMQEAREAMREFMQALAEQAERNQQAAQDGQQPQFNPDQMLSPQDLERMLDQIGELAETGSRDAAQQLLSQLQQMMENLQANNGQPQNPGDNQAQQMLNELGEMIQRQQQLMDQTFREQNGQDRPQQNGQQQGKNGQQRLQQLQEGQEGLAQQLQRFMEELQNNGMGQNQEFGEAGRSMSDAARELGEGNLPGANTDQGQALDQLRRGAQQLSNQMAGEGMGDGDHDLAQGNRGRDPLGRQDRNNRSDFGDDVEVPDEIDIQRAREILDAIRRRLGESLRPTIELEYLERLLRRE